MGYAPLELEARDVTGQHAVRLRAVAGDSTIGELVATAVSRMGLPRVDVQGRQLAFEARNEGSGQQLFTSEIVGEVLQTGDRIRVWPDISAGGGGA